MVVTTVSLSEMVDEIIDPRVIRPAGVVRLRVSLV